MKSKFSIKYLRLGVAMAVAATAGSFSTNAQVNAEQVLNIGRNVLSMDDYMLSIQYFNQAIKAKPYLSDPYFFRALAKLYLEDYKGAEEDCSLAIERNKFKTEAYKVRGFARQNLGKDSLAITDYNRGLEYFPMDKYFLFYKAVAQTELKDFPAAESTFSTLFKHFPQFDEGYTARGRMNILKGDTIAAVKDLDKAISISKNLINAYLMRAEIESQQKNWEGAMADIDAAIKLKPQEADLYINRAYVRYNVDDFFGAMSDYNYTLELEPYNTGALFNRALLRYEVKDLARSAEDFSKVLQIDPSNFHALFNRGLVYLEQNKFKDALSDFNAILKQYPRYYPALYASAEAYRGLGDMRTAMQLAHNADEMIRKYVKNPESNPLDRPKIASASNNKGTSRSNDDESEIDVMNRFNQLVTVGATSETQLSYNEKIKGRVQDRDLNVEPEPAYALSFNDASGGLKNVSNYFRELDDFNQQNYIPKRLYLTPGLSVPSEQKRLDDLFKMADEYDIMISEGHARPADLFALGVARTLLKNYPAAIKALDSAIASNDRFTLAYMARAFARYAEAVSKLNGVGNVSGGDDNEAGSGMLDRKTSYRDFQEVLNDYDKALTLNPRLVFAWFNKGNLYYTLQDYTSALQCFSEAINIDPTFGEAYYNRGLAYLQTGNKRAAFADLSKAGELGVLPSYNLLKRMK